jgi:PRTRC genetic system protein B
MKTDITLYQPTAALVVFTTTGSESPYIEYYDMDKSGCPINPHPLSVREAQSLAKALDTREQTAKAFLRPCGLLPPNVLHIDPSAQGNVLWYTPPQHQKLYFVESLGIDIGYAALPALVWKADKKNLQIFALRGKGKPRAETPLYNAPFFNLYRNGSVCMGSVDVRIRQAATLEEFVSAWQDYFFGSYFSHHIDNHNPITQNLISLYKDLIENSKPFPCDTLTKTTFTLKNLF